MSPSAPRRGTRRRRIDRIVEPSLCWHVDTKDDVTAVLSAWRAAMLRHPWATAVPARRRPTIGPDLLAWMEFLQAHLAAAGFTGAGHAAATRALYNHVMGSAASGAALQISDAGRRAGQEKLRADRERHPTLAANGYLYDDDCGGSFTLGVGYLLDGPAARL